LQPKTRIILKEWLFIIISVTLLMYLYYFFTWRGLEPYIIPEVFNGYVHSGYAYLEIGLQGVLFGIMFGLINLLIDRSSLRKRSFGSLILIKSILYFLAVSVSQLVVFLIYWIFDIFPVEYTTEMIGVISPSLIMSMSVYFILVILFINFILHINRKFGYGVLVSMLTGKYHKPRKERRIFMFLDMKDSTGNVQHLGHVMYSRLIQSCMHDLSDIAIRYRAQVYQYVGDEVVLSWKTKTGIKNLNFINLYFAYIQRLHDRKDFYQKYFRTQPEFKAGVAEGVVTVAEVGDIKRELAYHGDVLHTAARLEKLCNALESKMLITEEVLNQIDISSGYEIKSMGKHQLRGKVRMENVYGVSLIE
jgi:adenylate cyclase